MQRTKVGVIRGGRGPNFEASIKNGKYILDNIDTELFEPIDIWISREGIWHHRGFEFGPKRIMSQLDIAINSVTTISRDNVQRTLELFSVPYTGSRRLQAVLASNKSFVRTQKEEGIMAEIKRPPYVKLSVSENLEEELFDVFKRMPQPLRIAPLVGEVNQITEPIYGFLGIKRMVKENFEYTPEISIEEHIRGKKISCVVIEKYRGEELYVLPPIELSYKKEKGYEQICPANIKIPEKRKLENIARSIHREFELRNYSRVDMVLTPKGDVYLINIEPLPHLEGVLGAGNALEAVGASGKEFVEHLIMNAS